MNQRLALLMLGVLLAPAAQAQYQTSLRGTMRAYLSVLDQQCPKIAGLVDAARAERDEMKALMTQQLHQLMCTCQPEKVEAYLARLNEDQLAEQVDEKQFMATAITHILGPCMTEMMRETFSGGACERMTALSKKSGLEGFCSCMKPRLTDFSDADAIEIGTSFADYIPRLAQARKQGQPDPQRTPLMDRFIAASDQCGGGFLMAK